MTGAASAPRRTLPLSKWRASLALAPPKALSALLVGACLTLFGFWLTPPATAIQGGVLAFGLSWASFVDIDRKKLPDAITFGLAALGIGFALVFREGHAVSCALGLIVGYGFLAALRICFRMLAGQEGLGAGDAKLLGACGAWVGALQLPNVLAAASVCALLWVGICSAIFSSAPRKIPFGPFLSAACWLIWLLKVVELHALR